MSAGARWWERRAFATAATLCACIPLLWPAIPPLTDALGHLGRYRVMVDGGALPLVQWYSFRWALVGNMGVDLLVAALNPLLGLEPALKLVTLAIPAVTVAGILALSRAVHGRVSPFALFALPLAYGQPFHMGFLNFALAMGLALLALALWICMAPGWRRSVAFLGIALLLWVCHVFGWAVLALTAGAVEIVARRSPVRAALACWPLAAPVPVLLATSGNGAAMTSDFFDVRAKLLAMLMALRDASFVWDVVSLGVVLAAIAYGVREGTSDRRLAAAAVALLVAFLLLPGRLMGSAFADMRAAPFVPILALVALRPVRDVQARGLALLALAFCCARLMTTTLSLYDHAERQDRIFAAVNRIPVGARVAFLVAQNCDDPWVTTRMEHLGGVVTERRRAFVNDVFQTSGAELMRVHYPAAGAFERDPSQFLPCDGGASLRARIAAIPRGAFDRLLLVNLPVPPPTLPGTTRLWSGSRSALYAFD